MPCVYSEQLTGPTLLTHSLTSWPTLYCSANMAMSIGAAAAAGALGDAYNVQAAAPGGDCADALLVSFVCCVKPKKALLPPLMAWQSAHTLWLCSSACAGLAAKTQMAASAIACSHWCLMLDRHQRCKAAEAG